MQEEIRFNLVEGNSSNNNKGLKVEKEEEENVALVSKGKVRKGPATYHLVDDIPRRIFSP